MNNKEKIRRKLGNLRRNLQMEYPVIIGEDKNGFRTMVPMGNFYSGSSEDLIIVGKGIAVRKFPYFRINEIRPFR